MNNVNESSWSKNQSFQDIWNNYKYQETLSIKTEEGKESIVLTLTCKDFMVNNDGSVYSEWVSNQDDVNHLITPYIDIHTKKAEQELVGYYEAIQSDSLTSLEEATMFYGDYFNDGY